MALDEVNRMGNNIERYYVVPGDGCPFAILDHGRIHRVIAECGTREDAKKIASALNADQGAVEDLQRIAVALDPEQTTIAAASRIEFALKVARPYSHRGQ